jgi:sn-glycerol 3-phosphate transport system substrate-binding protein
MKVLSRAFVGALLLLVVAAGFAVASSQSETPSSAEAAAVRATEIQFWWFGGAVREPTMTKIVDKFQEANPEIDVNLQMFSGWGDLHQKSLLSIAGGNPPDVTLVKPMNLADLAERDSLLALDPYIDRDSIDTKKWFDIVAEYDCRWREKYYALPWNMAAYVLLYNKDRFAEAGLDTSDPPETWNELLTYAKKMTTDDQWGLLAPTNVNGFLMYLKQNGGEYLSADYKKALFDSPEGNEALNFLVDYIYKHKVAPPPGTTDTVDLYNGRIAMWYDHNGSLPNFKKFAPDLNFASAVNPRKDNPVTIEMSTAMSVFKESRFPDEAWELLKWMCYDDDMQLLWSQEIGHLPAVKGLVNQPPFTTEPKWIGYQKQVNIAMWARPVALRSLEMYQTLNSEVQGAYLQKKTPEQALDDAYARIVEIIGK